MARESVSGTERKFSASDISSVEEETLKRVDKTMKALEDFLSRWKASKIASGGVLPEVEKIKEFHRALSEWQRKALTGRGRGSDEERMERLEEFVLICRSYS
ncbi:MAG: hypothetical protein AB1295_02670 [Candidatus Micrarchaeota archaeon]